MTTPSWGPTDAGYGVEHQPPRSTRSSHDLEPCRRVKIQSGLCGRAKTKIYLCAAELDATTVIRIYVSEPLQHVQSDCEKETFSRLQASVCWRGARRRNVLLLSGGLAVPSGGGYNPSLGSTEDLKRAKGCQALAFCPSTQPRWMEIKSKPPKGFYL